METYILGLILVSLGFFAGIFGAVLGWLLIGGYYLSEMADIRAKANKAWGNNNTGKGVAGREEIEAEFSAAIAEASEIMKSEGKNEEKIARGLALAVKYPRAGKVLLREFRKVGIDKMASGL
jgi:hypothetical protein